MYKRYQKNFGISSILTVALFFTANFSPSYAGELIIDEKTDKAAKTSIGDGSGAGDISIEEEGEIEVETGAAVTVDSDHNITNDGTINPLAEADAIGILVATGSGTRQSAIINNGTISVPGPDADADFTDSDVNNYGILVEGDGIFSGSILNGEDGSISVGGNASAGIAIRSKMQGKITNDGSISVTGDKSFGIVTTAPVTGTIRNNGSINSKGQGSAGVAVGGKLEGWFLNTGNITATATTKTDNDDNKIAIEPQAALWVSADVTRGILLHGNGIPNEDETGAEEAKDGNVSSTGPGPAILISSNSNISGPADITIGNASASEYGLLNRGNVSAKSASSGVATTAIRIEGAKIDGTIYTTAIYGGLKNEGGNITAAALDADATAINIGDYGVVPAIINTGTVQVATKATVEDDEVTGSGGNAYGLLASAKAQVLSFENAGTIDVRARGLETSAYGIRDLSGNLTSFTNSGEITSRIYAESTGSAVAVDLSFANSAISFSNPGSVIGDVLLGSGDDVFAMSGGEMAGALYLGGGNNSISLQDGAVFEGGIYSAGNVNLDVRSSQLYVSANQAANVTSAFFDSSSTLIFAIDGINNTASLLQASGTVELEDGVSIGAKFAAFVSKDQRHRIIKAGSLLTDGSAISLNVSDVPFIYNFSLDTGSIDDGDLYINVHRKTAQDLGLTRNIGTTYEASVATMVEDVELGSFIANLQTEEDFAAAYRQLMPDTGAAQLSFAISGSNAATGAISRRLAAVRETGVDQRPLSGDLRLWGQQLGTILNQDAVGEDAGYSGNSLMLAFGGDKALGFLDAFGFSVAYMLGEIQESDSFDEEIAVGSTQLSLYGVWQTGGLFAEATVGVGFNFYKSKRRFFTEDISRFTDGSWNGYQFSGSWKLGYQLDLIGFAITPILGGTYLKVYQGGYTETGGNGIDLDWSARSAASLRGFVGGAISYPLKFDTEGNFVPEIRALWSRESKTDPLTTTAKFALGGDEFTVYGAAPQTRWRNFGFGLGYESSSTSIKFDYDMELASGYTAHHAGITFRVRF
jgi:uncharacterized protein with beta-barrel porin domain